MKKGATKVITLTGDENTMANILVVQDVEQNIVDIKLSLERSGHQVLIAKSVASAKTLLEAASFDLLICGAHLNEGTVFDLLKFVKNDPNRRSIPFACFCCSPTDLAKSMEESVRSTAKLLGADIYIAQDTFNPEQFRAAIESLLPPVAEQSVLAKKRTEFEQ
jgi:CheY-like chemotaxis protein